jgi:predicted nucleic acid-binding protein
VKAAARVLDSYSLIAYFDGEEGAEKMVEIIRSARDSGRSLLLSVINWGEVYYITLRESGREQAEEIAHLISTLPIEIIPADLELTKQAAEFKARAKMSNADCFAAALAKMRRAELVTGDGDFKQMQEEIKVLWIS